MIGIYEDSFLDFLKENLDDPVQVKKKNIVCRCPWCEYGKEKDHYHLWISIEAPIFHCFHGGCEQSGRLGKLIRKIQGSDISDKFVDKEKIREAKPIFTDLEESKIILPEIDEHKFSQKAFYLKKRLKFAKQNLENIKGLIFDVDAFIEKNQIPVDPTLFRIREFLHTNFVGFLTRNKHVAIFRNIDEKSDFRYYKLKINDSKFLDYYTISGGNPNSNKIILAEGIFDIFTEQIFDSLNLRKDTRLYASSLSSRFDALAKSIVFDEQIFRLDVVILSDRGVDFKFYKWMKKNNSHIINNMVVYLNKTGKDFNDTPVTPEKYII